MKNDNDIVGRMQRLFDLWGKFDRVYFKILHRWNLSYNAYLVLEELYHHPEGLEPAAVADQLSIPRQTMTFVLDSLEREGRLERLPQARLAHPGRAGIRPGGGRNDFRERAHRHGSPDFRRAGAAARHVRAAPARLRNLFPCRKIAPGFHRKCGTLPDSVKKRDKIRIPSCFFRESPP